MVSVSGIEPDLEQQSAAKELIRPSRALHLRPYYLTSALLSTIFADKTLISDLAGAATTEAVSHISLRLTL